MIFIIAAIIITVLCFAPTARGVCPAVGNRNPEPAVIHYQQINTDEITDPEARNAIQNKSTLVQNPRRAALA